MTAFSRKDLAAKISGLPSDDRPSGIAEAPAGTRTAIFAVHGVSPIQRYAFQDQVATALQAYLNAQAGSDVWKAVVYWPEVTKGAPIDVEGVRPSALRIHRRDKDPDDPTARVYDVYEGYWSPLSKGKTNIASALRWLLNATFLATSSTASIPCKLGKLLFDIGYVVTLLTAALLLCVAAVALGWQGWKLLLSMLPAADHAGVKYEDLIADPLRAIFLLPPVVYVEFIVDVLLGYVAAQIIVVYSARRRRRKDAAAVWNDSREKGHFREDVVSARAFHRAALVILWVIFGLLLGLAVVIPTLLSHQNVTSASELAWYVVYIAAAVAAIQGARALADFAVENVLGDVQIYATHDQNSTFYAIRQLIIATVTGAFKGVMSVGKPLAAAENAPGQQPKPSEPKPYYERIHILGHSLGSTIAMDVLILLRQMIEEKVSPDRHWEQIRSFTTFGTALEKTRFFFDVRQPTLNAAQDQWENDVYGRYFTDQADTLNNLTNASGIYWSNYWYFHDIVSNEIVSYESDSDVGDRFQWNRKTPRPICQNFEIKHERPLWAWVHGDYLADPLFWAKVGPILTS